MGGGSDDGDCAVPPGLSEVAGIAVGLSHMLALKSDGTVVGWGDNSYGESVAPAGLSGVVAVAAGAGALASQTILPIPLVLASPPCRRA